MKKLTISVIVINLLLVFILAKQCNKPKPIYQDAVNIKDSVRLVLDTMTFPYYDTIQIIEKATAYENYQHFKEVYGEPDTIYQETFIVDSSQIERCLKCEYALQAKTIETLFYAEMAYTIDSTCQLTRIELEQCKQQPKGDSFIKNARDVLFGVAAGILANAIFRR